MGRREEEDFPVRMIPQKERDALLTGALLRMERIRQGRGQKDVCFGICVPSYLSKIERGIAYADPVLAAELFGRLGIRYETDASVLERFREAMREYFYRLNYHLDTKEIYREWKEKDQELSYSPLAIEWLLVKGFEEEKVSDLLETLWEAMDPRQQAYGNLVLWSQNPRAEEGIARCRAACQVLDSAFAMCCLCMAYLEQGDYAAIHRMENKVVAAAVEEGNTWQLADYCYLNGTAYACLDLEEMMMTYYERSIRLLQNTAWNRELADLYYNIGATCISLKKYEEAWEYLEKAKQVSGEDGASVLHKKAIVQIRTGRISQGQELLKCLKKLLEHEPWTEPGDWLKYEEACMECQKDFLSDPKYLALLERLIAVLEMERHPGHLYFYKDVIVDAYKKQRKYKKALEFEERLRSISL